MHFAKYVIFISLQVKCVNRWMNCVKQMLTGEKEKEHKNAASSRNCILIVTVMKMNMLGSRIQCLRLLPYHPLVKLERKKV
jgi:hypothetical protein